MATTYTATLYKLTAYLADGTSEDLGYVTNLSELSLSSLYVPKLDVSVAFSVTVNSRVVSGGSSYTGNYTGSTYYNLQDYRRLEAAAYTVTYDSDAETWSEPVASE